MAGSFFKFMKNTEQRVDSEIIGTPELENINPEFALNSEKKGVAAIKEAERRMRLDEEIEKNLSAGLDRNKAFVKKYKIVGNKRVLVIEVIKNKIKDVVKNDPDHFVFDEAAMKAMKELEEELTDPFAKNIYDNLSEDNKKILLDHLVDNPVSPEKSEIIKVANGDDVINILSEAANNTASYSDNGYLVQLANRRDLKSDTKISDAACLYNLISPDGKALVQRIDYASAMILLEEQSENYQNKLKEDFDRDAESRKELTAEEIQEANSFEELKNVISHSTGIMGETEYFTPKELLDTIDNVEKFGFHFVYAVTSSGGLRDKVELLLSQSFEADDESTKELESQEDEKNESTAETENTV